MNRLKKHFAPFLAGAIILTLSSCNSSPVSSTRDTAEAPAADTPSLPSTALSDSATPTPASPLEETPSTSPSVTSVPVSPVEKTPSATQKATPTSSSSGKKTPVATQPSNTNSTKATATTQSKNTITLNIYRADNQCQTLVPEKVAIPTANPVNTAVGKVLEEANSSDFELAGYRVNVNNTGIATVDLRRSPNSQRQFASLSACEQFALFGSLRKTLTDNTQLKIKDVRFTEQGKNIAV